MTLPDQPAKAGTLNTPRRRSPHRTSASLDGSNVSVTRFPNLELRTRSLVSRRIAEQNHAFAERLIFDDFELRRRQAFFDKALSTSHENRMNKNPALVDQICLSERFDEGSAAG